MNTLRELWDFLADLWDTGNFWARLAIMLLATWPILMALAALTPYPAIKSIVAILPIFVVAFAFFVVIDPLVWAVVVAFPTGRKLFKWAALFIGIELSLGAYYAAVPVHTDRGLIPVVLLILLAGLFLAVGIPSGKTKKTIMSLVVISGIIITLVFFAGGREKIGDIGKMETSPKTPPPRAVAHGKVPYPETALVHDFSEEKIVDETEKTIEFFPDKWVGIILPTGVYFRTDPSVKMQIVFHDGTPFIDGPGLQPDYGDSLRRTVFAVRGVKGGALKLTLQPKK